MIAFKLLSLGLGNKIFDQKNLNCRGQIFYLISQSENRQCIKHCNLESYLITLQLFDFVTCKLVVYDMWHT